MKTFWPEKLSDFTERELIGAGQYGLVYKVFNPDNNRRSVIKLIEAVKTSSPQALKRFKREIKALQKIESPRVVKLLNYWIDPEFIAFEMEYIPGLSLERIKKSLQQIPYSRKEKIILRIFEEICHGLEDIHHVDLVHRDLKPSNILIKSEELINLTNPEKIISVLEQGKYEIKITDFGVVKDLSATVSITRSNDFLGTVAYVAPEQATGQKIDFSTDLYALGVIIYELLSGQNPFHKNNIYQTINAHLHEEPPHILTFNRDVPLDISHVLMLLLQKDPAERFYSAHRLRRLLEQRRSTTPNGTYDISILLHKSEPENKICPPFEQLLHKLKKNFSSYRMTVLAFENFIEKDHFIYHYQQLKEKTDCFYLSYNSEIFPDFIYSFTRTLLKQFSLKELENIKNDLPSDSFLRTLLDFYQIGDFYQQSQFIKKHFQVIPNQIHVYNWIELITKLLKMMCSKRQVMFLLSGLENYREYFLMSFLLPIIEKLNLNKIQWIILCPSKHLLKIPNFNNESFSYRIIDIRNYFTNQNNCIIDVKNFSSIFVKRSQLNLKKNTLIEKNIKHQSISIKEKKFLEYFALSGYINPIKFINYLLNHHFGRDGELILSLLNKKILKLISVKNSPYRIAFANFNLYNFYWHAAFRNMNEKHKEIILDFWESQKDLESKEILLTKLTEFGENSRACLLLRELLDFYYSINDFHRHNQLLIQLLRLKKNYKIPHALWWRFEVHRILQRIPTGRFKINTGKYISAFNKISEKYKADKQQLLYLLILVSLINGEEENVQKLFKILKEYSNISGNIEPYISLTQAIYLVKQGKLDLAIEEISTTLIKLGDRESYWIIPTGSYMIAEIYLKKFIWEKSYQYAAMAFQTGRVLNDFWIMNQSLKLILQNPYYYKNRAKLVNWKILCKKLLNFNVRRFDQIDIRSRLLKIIH